MDDTDRQIAERAHHLWETEGKPDGKADEHWERARFLVGIMQNPNSGTLPNPSIPTVQNPSGTAPAHDKSEPLREAVENLGEFPGQTDQGEKAQAPIATGSMEEAASDEVNLDVGLAAKATRRRKQG